MAARRCESDLVKCEAYRVLRARLARFARKAGLVDESREPRLSRESRDVLTHLLRHAACNLQLGTSNLIGE